MDKAFIKNPVEAYEKLKEENYQLKKEKEVLKKWHWEEKTERERLEELNSRLDNQRETYWEEYKKLKQTLAEIKEIAYELTNEEYTDFIEGKQKQIIQKISEVEDGRI